MAVLLGSLRELPVDRTVAEGAGRIRRETGLRLPDALIAATAIAHDLQLATRNRRDFDRVQGLPARPDLRQGASATVDQGGHGQREPIQVAGRLRARLCHDPPTGRGRPLDCAHPTRPPNHTMPRRQPPDRGAENTGPQGSWRRREQDATGEAHQRTPPPPPPATSAEPPRPQIGLASMAQRSGVVRRRDAARSTLLSTRCGGHPGHVPDCSASSSGISDGVAPNYPGGGFRRERRAPMAVDRSALRPSSNADERHGRASETLLPPPRRGPFTVTSRSPDRGRGCRCGRTATRVAVPAVRLEQRAAGWRRPSGGCGRTASSSGEARR